MSVILGMAWSHDASAGVLRDDSLLAAVCGVRMLRMVRMVRMACDGRHLPQPARHAGNARCRTVTGRYRRLSGMALVLNSSFYRPQEPIEYRPHEAARTLVDRRIDKPALGNLRVPGDAGHQ